MGIVVQNAKFKLLGIGMKILLTYTMCVKVYVYFDLTETPLSTAHRSLQHLPLMIRCELGLQPATGFVS